jgi:hypothetical protein
VGGPASPRFASPDFPRRGTAAAAAAFVDVLASNTRGVLPHCQVLLEGEPSYLEGELSYVEGKLTSLNGQHLRRAAALPGTAWCPPLPPPGSYYGDEVPM